jgi:hypothetical protein
MKTSFGVLWQQAEGDAVAGRLELLRRGLWFTQSEEAAGGEEVAVRFEGLAAIVLEAALA